MAGPVPPEVGLLHDPYIIPTTISYWPGSGELYDHERQLGFVRGKTAQSTSIMSISWDSFGGRRPKAPAS